MSLLGQFYFFFIIRFHKHKTAYRENKIKKYAQETSKRKKSYLFAYLRFVLLYF